MNTRMVENIVDFDCDTLTRSIGIYDSFKIVTAEIAIDAITK